MVKNIQIGDVYGDLKEVQLEDNQTLADALQQAGLAINNAQQLIANSTSQPVSVDTVPDHNEVYLLAGNQTSG